MKKLLLLAAFLGTGSLLFSQDVSYSEKFLERLNEARNPHFHQQTKGGHGSDEKHDCLSMLILEGVKNYNLLTKDAQKTLDQVSARTPISDKLTYDSDHFRFHYTKLGADAVPLADSDVDGTPNYVESMAVIFEHVYTEFGTNLSYGMPPSDDFMTDDGGNGLYDIYISDLGTGLYGFVSTSSTFFVGNNSNSTQTETAAMASWMGMNNDYSWATNFGITATEAIEVTAAHEFFHAVQYGITIEEYQFFYESTAAWMEDVLYPGHDDNLQYLPLFFNYPDASLNFDDELVNNASTTYPFLDGHWYSSWIFWKYVQERYGINMVRDMWYNAIDDYQPVAINKEFVDVGTTYKEVFLDFLIANYLLESGSSYSPYTYTRANDYFNVTGGVEIEDTYNYTGSMIVHFSTVQGNKRLMPLSADYIELTANQNFSVNLYSDVPSDDLNLIVVKYHTTNSALFDVQTTTASGNNQFISVSDASTYNKFAIIVGRFHSNANNFNSSQYTIRIGGVTSTMAPTATVNRMYPNPADDKFIVEYSTNSNATLEMMDFTGKVVYTSSLNEAVQGNHVVNSEILENGIYFVMIKNESGVLAKEKIVITK